MLKLKVSIKMQFYKKSQIVLKYIFVAILMVLIFYSFAEGGKSRGEKIDQFKLGIAKDIALLVNTLYSTNGDVKYIYQNNIKGYGVQISDGTVAVFKGDIRDPTIAKYKFVEMEGSSINVQVNNIDYLQIEKIGTAIKLSSVS